MKTMHQGQSRQQEATATTSIEILVTRTTATPGTQETPASPQHYRVTLLEGRKQKETPRAFSEQILAYIHEDDFEDDSTTVLMFDITAKTTYWREKYGHDIDGNRWQWQTFYGDLRITAATGPRPVPAGLLKAFSEILDHEHFDWKQ